MARRNNGQSSGVFFVIRATPEAKNFNIFLGKLDDTVREKERTKGKAGENERTRVGEKIHIKRLGPLLRENIPLFFVLFVFGGSSTWCDAVFKYRGKSFFFLLLSRSLLFMYLCLTPYVCYLTADENNASYLGESLARSGGLKF